MIKAFLKTESLILLWKALIKKGKLGLKNFKIREMLSSDLDEVFKIENLSNPTPWSSSSFLDCLKGNYLNLVIEDGKQVIGYCISTINFTESHLLNISIKPNFRNLGIGETLLDYAEKECIKKMGKHSIVCSKTATH